MSAPGLPTELGNEFMGLVRRAVSPDDDWEGIAADAARELHSLAFTHALLNPGRHVWFEFPVTPELQNGKMEAAIEAFDAEWSRLVPGWKPPTGEWRRWPTLSRGEEPDPGVDPGTAGSKL
ncbi:MAG TPA: hypothetical protein VHG72_21875 [Polyangia bacterium]|nr:hypothetical protein [Polyangia bacterium]